MRFKYQTLVVASTLLIVLHLHLFGGRLLGRVFHRECHACPTSVAASAGFRPGMEIARGHQHFRLVERGQMIVMMPVVQQVAVQGVPQNLPTEESTVDFTPSQTDVIVSNPSIVPGAVIQRGGLRYRIGGSTSHLMMLPLDQQVGLQTETVLYQPVTSDVIVTQGGPILTTLGGLGRFVFHGVGGGGHHHH